MHIGFDISQTGRAKAGCGYYAHALIQAMIGLAPEHRYSLYPSFGDFFHDARMPLLNPYGGSGTHYGPRYFLRALAGRFWTQPDLEEALGWPDILHANNFWCPPRLGRARLIYTLYDMCFARAPAWTTEVNRRGCFSGVFRAALAADWVVAISQTSRHHFLETFPHFPVARVKVIHPCSRFVDRDQAGRRPHRLGRLEPGAFWLSVGTLEPRKNQRRLAEAYARYLARGGRPMPLVFAGGQGWLMEGFARDLDRLGVRERVILAGYVADEELVWLYRHCFANLYPSLFEGFGLPVLEGFQFGAPTLAANSTALPEVAGDAAILLAPEDAEAWATAMLDLSAHPERRNGLISRGKRQARRFDWRNSARQLLDLYAEALATPKAPAGTAMTAVAP